MRRNKILVKVPIVVFSVAFLFTLGFLLIRNKINISAASLDKFSAGNIISDYVMSNYTSMSEAEIQSFLKSKNSCNNRDYVLYQDMISRYPNISWSWRDGHFVCMADESFNGESAAHIIWQAAQDFRINPQVLIVLLEKEQGLVTDDFPNSHQYKTATGFGCPDTAACDSEYFGFKNQVRNAAELYRWILDHGSRYYPLGWNYVRYNPNSACGGSDVYIENNATAALYQYTPYQPNASALSAGYGTGDVCGAYGNRNFYLYFNDWFGDSIENISENIDVPESYYYIVNKQNYHKAIDIKNGDLVAGNNVQVYDRNNTNAQKWKIKKDTNDSYILSAAYNQEVVLSVGENDNIYLEKDTGRCSQRWKITHTRDNSLMFVSTCDMARVIDIESGAYINESNNISARSINNSDTQKWDIVPISEIEGGLYIINSVYVDRSVDIDGGVYTAKNGTNIHLYDTNHTQAQRWKIINVGDDVYEIINPQTGKSLDVFGAEQGDGVNLQLYDRNNTNAQKWRIIQNNDFSVTFMSLCSYRVIDVSGGGTSNGTNIQLWSANNTNAQKWQLHKEDVIDNGVYSIISKLNSYRVIDVSGGGTSNGTNIQLWSANNTNAQKWQLHYDDDRDLYSIINAYSGKALDVSGGGTSNGTNIQLWSANNTCAQKWFLQRNGENNYTFISDCSGKALDVSGGGTSNGTNIQLWSANNTNAQKWQLIRD